MKHTKFTFPGGRSVELLDVTPETAQKWLDTNTHNRPLRWRRALSYELAMKKGEWILTPDYIAFSKPWLDPDNQVHHPETLIEGQHRLRAIIDSGVTVPMTIWRGCEPEEMRVIGQGAERTNGDILAISRPGLKDPTVIALVASAFVSYVMGYNIAVDAWMIQEIFSSFETEVLEVVKYKKILGSLMRREMTAVFLLAHLIDPEMARNIFTRVKSGIGFTKSDPIRFLYLYLYEWRSGLCKDTVDVYFLRVCNAVAAALNGTAMTKRIRADTVGLKWLRTGAKTKLDPLLARLFITPPKDFYHPRLAEETEAEAAK